jgi:hypothetical protein
LYVFSKTPPPLIFEYSDSASILSLLRKNWKEIPVSIPIFCLCGTVGLYLLGNEIEKEKLAK